MKRAFVVIAAVTVLAALSVFPVGAEEPEWQADLLAQLEREKNCEMLYVTNTRESELGGERTVSGRAHCADGRNFDFARLKPYLSFELKACEPVVC